MPAAAGIDKPQPGLVAAHDVTLVNVHWVHLEVPMDAAIGGAEDVNVIVVHARPGVHQQPAGLAVGQEGDRPGSKVLGCAAALAEGAADPPGLPGVGGIWYTTDAGQPWGISSTLSQGSGTPEYFAP